MFFNDDALIMKSFLITNRNTRQYLVDILNMLLYKAKSFIIEKICSALF
jgi:hypothetical protein